MMLKVVIFATLILPVISAKSRPPPPVPEKTAAEIKKTLEEYEQILSKVNKSKASPIVKITNYVKAKFIPEIQEKDEVPKIISHSVVKEWAEKLSETLLKTEKWAVRRDELMKGFKDVKMEVRDGAAIVNTMAESIEELLNRRAHAAEEIMRKAEALAKEVDFKDYPSDSYTFDYSVNLDQSKKKIPPVNPIKYPFERKPLICRSVEKVKLRQSKQFEAPITLDRTSVHVAEEVFDCDPQVIQHLQFSERLLSTFQKNYAQDSSTNFQYFCSAKGFLRHYPATTWSSMFTLNYNEEQDIYDCRLRPWYVSAGGAPRDVLILLDASGSMNGSSNLLIAEQFTLALLTALTDDDHVNVLRFNVQMESPIGCFSDKLVPANHVNSAAMMAALYPHRMINTTWMEDILKDAIRLLKKQRKAPDREPACQQAIVLLTDSVYENYTMTMRKLDPTGKIRLFVLWLHDPNGLRDNTRAYAEFMSCDRDGYYAELITHADVTEQVMRILRVMERPLVGQRKDRLRVFSDVYAHVEDPRRGEQLWQMKENDEQAYRYRQLRRNKAQLLSPAQRYKDYMHQKSLDKYGFYLEDPTVNYKLVISVSVPVFDHTTLENITIQLDEEKQRNSTRTYPVNRLLGVAGVDIPLDQLKMILPYHQLGGGGTLFLLDHRGNIVLHDNIKSTFDGDILRPGYRTVDFFDLEQPAIEHFPRYYPADWMQFRRSLIIEKVQGNMTMFGKNIFEGGLRVNLEMREYHWRRVLDHYTAVVVIPPYSRHHMAPETSFTKQIAEDALKTLSRTEFAVHPTWLYCRHVDPYFDTREAEVLHFIRRRSDEPDFAMKKLRHNFLPIPPTLLDKAYQCDEELMAKLCKEVIATEKWAKEHETPDTGDCSTCKLGAVTAFFTSESGLTRWHQYHATGQHAPPPSGGWWAAGPSEPWYRRAAARPGALVVHIPLAPVRKLRNTFLEPPSLGAKHDWLTAARTLGTTDKGFVGVAGFHFYPQHLIDVLIAITEFPCIEDDKSLCKPRCDESWHCVLVDEGGWVVARDRGNNTRQSDVREHLATLHPAAMTALLDASVFQLKRVHDYQAVCFPPWYKKNSAPMIPSLLKSLWHTIGILFYASQQVATLFTFIYTSSVVSAETQKEKEKRQRNLKKNYEREKYERLFDERVIINKTVFAACDRTRVFYQLQHSQKAMEALSRTPKPSQLEDCSWPLVGALVPNTNLLLLALYNCSTPYEKPTPLYNRQYMEVEPYMDNMKQSPASQLACWRNRVALPGRLPKTKCYPHNYSQEIGYRQCGPWLPDPEEDESSAISLTHSKLLLTPLLLLLL